MDIQLLNQQPDTIETEALVVVTFEKDDTPPVFLAPLAPSDDLPGKLYEGAVYASVPGVKAKRVVAIGGGKRDKFGSYEMRRATGAAVRLLKPKAYKEITFVCSSPAPSDVQAAVEGAIVADFDPGRFKTEGRSDDKHLGAFRIAGADTPENRAALERGRIIGESQNFPRYLVNYPPHYFTPPHPPRSPPT